jgi:ribosome-associated protein
VHVFHEEERVYYSLERLWKDCPVLPIELPSARALDDAEVETSVEIDAAD